MKRLFCTLLMVLLLGSGWAAAEPIALTSGRVVFTDEPGGFLLAGSGFTLQGGWYPSEVTGTFWYDRCWNFSCSRGEAVDFGTTTYGFSASESEEFIQGTIGGTVYNQLFVDADLTFNGPRVIPPAGTDPFVVATGPFSMTGRVAAYQDRLRTGPPVFVADLFGSGTANVEFVTGPSIGPGLGVINLEYQFANPEPIPEPSTMLLIGTGLLAGASHRMKRRVRL